MAFMSELLRVVRHGCSNVYCFVQAHGCDVSRFTVFEASCDEAEDVQVPEGLTFRAGSPADLEALNQRGYDMDTAAKCFCRDRLLAGDSLILGEENGEVIFYACVMYSNMDLDMGKIVPLASDLAYSYKVYTAPSARGRRICSTYYALLKRILRNRGYRRVVCRVAPSNPASMRAHLRANFHAVGDLFNVTVARIPHYWASQALVEWFARNCAAQCLNGHWFRTLTEQNCHRYEV